MTCQIECKKCTSGNRQYEIVNYSYPTSSLTAGSPFNVSVDVKLNAIVGQCYVCVYEVENPSCIVSSQLLMYVAGGTQTVILPLIMADHEMHLNITVAEPPLFGVGESVCEDVRYATIRLQSPPGMRFSCQGGQCIQNPNGYYPDQISCQASCSASTIGCQNCDPAQNMCVMGMCLPKPMVLVGLAAIVYMIVKGK